MSGLARQASKISINLASAIHREAVIIKKCDAAIHCNLFYKG